MKIALISQWFPPEKAAIPADIAAELARLGHDVTVITGYPNYPTGRTFPGWRQHLLRSRRTATQGFAVLRVPEYPSHDRSALRRVASYLSFAITSTVLGWRTLRTSEVVYVYHPPLTAAWGAWLACKVRGIPYVLHVQDLWPESVLHSGLIAGSRYGLLVRALDAMCQRIYADAARIIVIAHGMRARLESRGVEERRIVVVFNWADESIFKPTDRDPVIDAELGVERRFTVMFAGNVGDAQALDVAVDAAAMLRDLDDFQLVIVGDGVALRGLRRTVEERRISSVRFVSSQPIERMNRVTASADVQLVSLRAVDFFAATIPSKLSAILASGLPAICAVAGDASRVVAEARAGWTCPPGDPGALAKAFRSAHDAPTELLRSMGISARRYYVANFSRTAGTSAIARILESVGRAV